VLFIIGGWMYREGRKGEAEDKDEMVQGVEGKLGKALRSSLPR